MIASARATFESHGVVFAVHSADTASLDAVPTCLSPGARESDAERADLRYVLTRPWNPRLSRHEYVVAVDTPPSAGLEIARVTERAVALELLVQDAEFRVACLAPHDVFVHAGVVAVNGRAALFPGHSFAGKSTLIATLVRAGALYYSDEYAVLTRDGLVAPFARRIATRDARGAPGPRLRPEDLGGNAGVTPVPIGAVIVTRYTPDAVWRPQPLTRGQTVLALLEHAVTARTRPDHTLDRVAASVGPTVVGLEGHRGSATDTARAIMQRLQATAS